MCSSDLAGKTTTIEILEGLLAPTSGSVEVLGLSWATDERRLREQIGVSLQETRLADRLTVLETVRLFRSFYPRGIEPLAALEMVGLVPKAAAWVNAISGGERQRLAVATAIVGWPKLLFLDEPTTGLDPRSRIGLWEVIRDLVADGTTVLLTTQYLEEADQLAEEIVVIDRGRAIATGTSDQLKDQVGGDRLEVVVGSASVLPTAVDALRRIASGEVSVNADQRRVTAPVTGGSTVLVDAVRELDTAGVSIDDVVLRRPTLDDVFLTLTGHAAEEGS